MPNSAGTNHGGMNHDLADESPALAVIKDARQCVVTGRGHSAG
jgi:hypothetical protein